MMSADSSSVVYNAIYVSGIFQCRVIYFPLLEFLIISEEYLKDLHCNES